MDLKHKSRSELLSGSSLPVINILVVDYLFRPSLEIMYIPQLILYLLSSLLLPPEVYCAPQ